LKKSTFAMKMILVLGAGRSASSLIDYLINECNSNGWKLRVGDYSLSLAQEKCNGSAVAQAFQFDILNEQQRAEEIKKADVVISMLPANFHPIVAELCVEYGVNMLTASYVSKEMKALDEKAKQKGDVDLSGELEVGATAGDLQGRRAGAGLDGAQRLAGRGIEG
ncbi:MAG: saccharopine dehydrogenase NADP-binding domain-containing protein, partial [Pseudomonadales bacterium]